MTATAGGTAAAGPEIEEGELPSAVRSPSDVLRLAVAAVVLAAALVLQWLAGDELVSFAANLTEGLDALPAWLISVLVVTTWALAVVVLLGGTIVVVVQGRWRALATILVAGAAAAALTALLGVAHEPSSAPAVDVDSVSEGFQDAHAPTELTLGAVTAIVTAASPWVSRRWRRLAWVLVLGLMFTRALASPVALESLRAVLGGWLVGAAVVVALGGPARRARGSAIAEGLARVGLPLQRLEQASLDARGSTPYFGVSTDGRRLFVKALGRDERSADLLFRVYRRILPRDLGDERGYLSLRRAVEHEALLALAARDLGVRTPRFLALAEVAPASFVLTYEAIEGKSLDRLDAGDVSDEILSEIWSQVGLLRAHRVAHRDLRLANLFLGADGSVWLIDFGFSELAASETLLATDVAELLASSSLQVGVERAVAVAQRSMGTDALAGSLDRLRPWALAGATRTALGERPQLLDELRARARGPARRIVRARTERETKRTAGAAGRAVGHALLTMVATRRIPTEQPRQSPDPD